MKYLQGYYYELIKANAQCSGQTRISNDEITLQECFRLTESRQGNPCAERIIEWGEGTKATSFELNSVGWCLCYPDKYTEERIQSDGGEHLIRFIPENFMTITTSTSKSTTTSLITE